MIKVVRTDKFLSIVVEAKWRQEVLDWKEAIAAANEHLSSVEELGIPWVLDKHNHHRRSDFAVEVHYKQKERGAEPVLRADACPLCQSENVVGGQFTVETAIAYQGMICEDCDARWVVVFAVWAIKMVEPTEIPDG